MNKEGPKQGSKGIDYVLSNSMNNKITGLADLRALQDHFISLDNQTGLVASNTLAMKKKEARLERRHRWKSHATRAFRKKHQIIDEKAITKDSIAPIAALWDEYAERIGDNESNVARMDLHGAQITVLQSPDPTLAGLSGRVLRETYGTLFLVCEDNKIRMVSKKHTTVDLHTPKGLFELNLDAIRCRPFLRPTKKWKARIPIDLPF